GYIDAPYDHYGFSHGISHWIARHNHYSTNEVELILRLRTEPLRIADLLSRNPVLRRRGLKRLAARSGCRPFLRFAYLYFLRFGFLDGRAGLLFCLLRVAHEIHITAKLAEAEVKHERHSLTATPRKSLDARVPEEVELAVAGDVATAARHDSTNDD